MSKAEKGSNPVRMLLPIVERMQDAATVSATPPSGPPERFPALGAGSIEALKEVLKVGSSKEAATYYANKEVELQFNEYDPVVLEQPSSHELHGFHLAAIAGRNTRVDHPGFSLIIARARRLLFKYDKHVERPAFEQQGEDVPAVFISDTRYFRPTYAADLNLPDKEFVDGTIPLEKYLDDYDDRPIYLEPKKLASNKGNDADLNLPRNQALGIAVRLQQALEARQFDPEPDSSHGLVLKNGPLYYTSMPPLDNVSALRKTFLWKNAIFMATSTRLVDSSVLSEALQRSATLRDHWFKDQNTTSDTFASLPGDLAVLPNVLKPGERTPWMRAVPRARVKATDADHGGDSKTTPVMCYYRSRRPGKPRFIRIETPMHFMENRRDAVEFCARVVAWQFELGVKDPMIHEHAERIAELQNDHQHLLRRATGLMKAKGHYGFD